MSAFEIIEQIKELPANEQARVARFIAENGSSMTHRKFSVGTEGDGLPVIRADGGRITSQLVREIDCIIGSCVQGVARVSLTGHERPGIKR